MFAWTLGPTEVGIILLLALILFGRRLPETGRSLGEGIKEFKKGLKGGLTEDDKASPREPGRVIDGQAPLPSDERRDRT